MYDVPQGGYDDCYILRKDITIISLERIILHSKVGFSVLAGPVPGSKNCAGLGLGLAPAQFFLPWPGPGPGTGPDPTLVRNT